MMLQHWEVLHVRTSQYRLSVGIEEAAERLVESGACVAAFVSDGTCIYSEDGEVKQGAVGLDYRPHASRARTTLPSIPDQLALVCILSAVEAAFAERKTFNGLVIEQTRYVRCFFEPILIGSDDNFVTLYPSAKIYENGTAHISLRLFSPDRKVSLDSLVEDYLGLTFRYFEKLLISPRLLLAAPKEDMLSHLVGIQPTLFEKQTPTDLAEWLVGEAVGIEEEDGTREYRAIDFTNITQYVMLEFIWMLLEGTVDSVGFRPVKLTPKAYKLRTSGYDRDWFGHPTVFLIAWAGQPYLASKLAPYEPDIGRCLARSKNITPAAIKTLVKAMPRLYDDYRAYVSECASVYAFARLFLENAQPEDTHFQRLTLSMHVNEELALWLIGSYRGLEKKAAQARSNSDLRRVESELRTLEGLTERLTHFGELEEFFSEYLSRFRVPTVIERTRAYLTDLEQDQKDAANIRISSFSALASFLFGVVGSGQIAENVFDPLRSGGVNIPTLFGLPTKLSDFILAAAILSVVGMMTWTLVARLKRSS